MTDTLLDDTNQNDPQIDPSKNYVQELVGDGKKFKSLEDLARGKLEADMYIKTLERKNDEMRTDYLKVREENMAKAKLEELIDRLSTNNQQHTSNDSNLNVNDATDKTTFDPKALDSLVSNKIQEHENARRQQENFNTVRNKLREQFGDNYSTVLKDQMTTLGLTKEAIDSMARTNPNVLLRALGIDQAQRQETFQAPPRTNQRSDNFTPKTTKRTWAFYQEMKKNDPKSYADPKTTVQMHKDAIELGDAFTDGDWNAL